MTQKTQVIEKRVKSTVIRRRRKPAAQEVKPDSVSVSAAEVTEEPKVLKVDAPEKEQPKKVDATAIKAVPLKKAPKITAVKRPKKTSDAVLAAKRRVANQNEAGLAPEEQKALKKEGPKTITVDDVQPDSSKKTESVKPILSKGRMEKVEFKKRPNEMSRKPKLSVKAPVQETTTQAPTAGEPAKVDETEESKKKAKKGVKRKGRPTIEVDLEEISPDVNAKITRLTHGERVFQPGRGPKRKRVVGKKSLKKTQITQAKAIKRVVEVDQTISVADLANALGIKARELVKVLANLGVEVAANENLDFDTATLAAGEYNFEVKSIAFDEAQYFDATEDESADLVNRPPVVTVMGHVDHGKTSLLDAIRQSNVVKGEAGGITQHIGAYTIDIPKGKVTFLDTPGHEAFTAMRARGAAITDIVILVVAADDGVMPQTIESIDHAKAAEVPIVVAINKVDKPEADVDRIKRQLAEHDLAPEEWGGQTLFGEVSALKNKGITGLLETVLLQAEVMELRANPKRKASGIVVEARLDKGRGVVATFLVQKGTLKVGDAIVVGPYAGRVRSMRDYSGKAVKNAGPSFAVEIMGLSDVPSASDVFEVVKNEKIAREIATNRQQTQKQKEQTEAKRVSLEDFLKQKPKDDLLTLNLIVKADVHGSMEAVRDAVMRLATEKVDIKVIHCAVGGINESDILLAKASQAVVIGFNVRPETKAIALAKLEAIDVKVYKIIYQMVEEVKLAMQGLLAPKEVETYLGRAEVRQTFHVSKAGTIAGSYVVDGKILRNANLRLLRDNVILFEGKITSLKRFKDDAKEVAQGFECGIGIEKFNDIKEGDVIEAYQIELKEDSL